MKFITPKRVLCVSIAFLVDFFWLNPPVGGALVNHVGIWKNVVSLSFAVSH